MNNVIRHFAAQVIWIGRRELIGDPGEHRASGTVRLLLDDISADATDRTALQSAYDEIKRRFSRINGVVHAAIVLQDQSLARMDESVFGSVFRRRWTSAFVWLRSSLRNGWISCFLFIDYFLRVNERGPEQLLLWVHLQGCFCSEISSGLAMRCEGHELGYWGSVGITASDMYRQRMAQQGIGSIESPGGM